MKNDSSHHIGDLVYDKYRKSLGFIIKIGRNNNPFIFASENYTVQWVDDQQPSTNTIPYIALDISRMKKDLEQYMEKKDTT